MVVRCDLDHPPNKSHHLPPQFPLCTTTKPHNMGGNKAPMAFLNKKGWHPGSFRNQEKKWKLEQAAKAEAARVEEIRKQLAETREKEELDALAIAAGVKPASERLDWMYQGGPAEAAGDDAAARAEAALLGAVAVEPTKLEAAAARVDAVTSAPALAGPSAAAVAPGPAAHSANETWARLHGDPLFAIKQREAAARAALASNPAVRAAVRAAVDKVRGGGGNGEASDDRRHRHRSRDDGHRRHRHRSSRRSRSRSRDGDSRRRREDDASSCRRRRSRDLSRSRDRAHRDDDRRRPDAPLPPPPPPTTTTVHHDAASAATNAALAYGLNARGVAGAPDPAAVAAATRERLAAAQAAEAAARAAADADARGRRSGAPRREYVPSRLADAEKAARLAAMEAAASEQAAVRDARAAAAAKAAAAEDAAATGGGASGKFLNDAARALHGVE